MKERTLQEEIDARHRVTVLMHGLKVLVILTVITLFVVWKPSRKSIYSEEYLSSMPTVLKIPINTETYNKLQHQEIRITADRNGKAESYIGIPLSALFLDPAGPAHSFVFQPGDNIALRYRADNRRCTAECDANDILSDAKGKEELLVLNDDGSFTIVSPTFFVLDSGYYEKAVRIDVLRRSK